MVRLWSVWGVNPTTQQFVELVIVAGDHVAACNQLEQCGLMLVDAAEYHPGRHAVELASR